MPKSLCGCGVLVGSSEQAKREHLNSGKHKQWVQGKKSQRPLNFPKLTPVQPTEASSSNSSAQSNDAAQSGSSAQSNSAAQSGGPGQRSSAAQGKSPAQSSSPAERASQPQGVTGETQPANTNNNNNNKAAAQFGLQENLPTEFYWGGGGSGGSKVGWVGPKLGG